MWETEVTTVGQNCYLLNCIGYKLDQIFSTAYCKVLFKAMHSIACVTGRQGGKKVFGMMPRGSMTADQITDMSNLG